MIQRTGFKHWELIKTTFGRSREYEQEAIIDALGALKDPASPNALGELMALRDLTVRLDQWGLPDSYDAERLLRAYVRAAQVVNHGRPVVDSDLVEKACLSHPFKGQMYDAVMKQHDANVPAARSQALEQLRQFFSGAAQP